PAARALTENEAASYALTCMARPQSDLKLHRGRYPPSLEDASVAATTADDD
ncbi:MAG: (2Fe-2S)-binding protein, partial [Haloplanus sp.]